jgi:hypothetical protein
MNLMDCALPELLDVIQRIDVITIMMKRRQLLRISLVKHAAKIQTMYPKYMLSSRKENMEHCYFIIKKFSCNQLYPLEEVLTQQSREILSWYMDLQVILHRAKTFHLENMKTLSLRF